jgi:hypothetical protein
MTIAKVGWGGADRPRVYLYSGILGYIPLLILTSGPSAKRLYI